MQFNDFFRPSLKVSTYQINKLRPRVYLKDVKKLKFSRGSFDMQYANNFEDPFTACNIFTSKQLKTISNSQFEYVKTLEYLEQPVGIDNQQKTDIIKNLVPLMPSSKSAYWINMPVVN